MDSTKYSAVVVRRKPSASKRAIVAWNGWNFEAILGRGAIRTLKLEGDGATPSGHFKILYGFWRADKMRKPVTTLNMIPIRREYGWCDAPNHACYNERVKITKNTIMPSHEELWRNDNLYDICLVINHNNVPRIRNRGSAVFIHLQHPDRSPTRGCIALSLKDMHRFLRSIRTGTKITIHP